MTQGLSLSARGIRHAFRSGFSLDVSSLDVPAGSTLALLGPSGSGKSTLLAILGLLERPEAGSVFLDGVPVTARDRAARLAMAAVFQRPYLIKGTVRANVEYGLKLRHVAPDERRSRVDQALERVGMSGMGDRAAATLSGGEAHRVALARALVLSPRVLLLDEPLASLDTLLKRRLTGEFSQILRAEEVTVVWVTHDHNEALVVSDLVAVMNAGRVVACGPTQSVMMAPTDEWTARFLGVEVPLSGEVVESDGGLLQVRVGRNRIAAVGAASVGERVLLALPAEDVVLLAPGEDAVLSSARNLLDATVREVDPRGATMRLTLDADGSSIAASVSRASYDEMRLTVGAPVRALFKATAVRVYPVADETGHIPGEVS